MPLLLGPGLWSPTPRGAWRNLTWYYNDTWYMLLQLQNLQGQEGGGNAFGILSSRLWVFHEVMFVHPDNVKDIAIVCVVLHNMFRSQWGAGGRVEREIPCELEEGNGSIGHDGSTQGRHKEVIAGAGGGAMTWQYGKVWLLSAIVYISFLNCPHDQHFPGLPISPYQGHPIIPKTFCQLCWKKYKIYNHQWYQRKHCAKHLYCAHRNNHIY